MTKQMSYKQSGVDIDLANDTKKELKGILKNKDPRVLNSIGAFGSLYDINFPEYKNPVLVLKTEEPGSKQLLAFQYDKYESIGMDMINHLIDDCIVMGAKPLAVQDAIICGKHEQDKILKIIKGISLACADQGCTLTGGEISEQPGVIPAGSYILTSSIVGIVDREDIIDGSAIKEGDVVISLESSGPHTNGYTLIRKLLESNPALAGRDVDGIPFVERVLESHRCYYTYIKDLFPKKAIAGMAHITGGGIKENLNRVLPEKLDALVDLSAIKIPAVFRVIKEAGNVADSDMLRTFNLGVGFIIACSPENTDVIIRHLNETGLNANIIGSIVKGNGKVTTKNSLQW